MRLVKLLQKELNYQFGRLARLFKPNKVVALDTSVAEKKSFSLPNWKWWLKLLGVLWALGVVGVVALFGMVNAGIFGKLPTEAELLKVENDNASEFYTEDGALLGKFFTENRSDIQIFDISENVVYALIATEDVRFFKHAGVDYRALGRVLWKSILLRRNESGGGSTISQQLSKNLFPRQRYNRFSLVINKIRESIIARRLERVYSKEGLLNLYLNTVPFSHNVYGIKVASERFFNKSPEELKLEEAAVLIGMLKATTYYDPVRYPERSLQRRNIVLSQLAKYDYLKKEVCDSLKAIPLTLDYQPQKDRSKVRYFKAHIQKELQGILANLAKSDNRPYNLYADGLKIYTTLDASLQEYAEYAVKKQMSSLQKTFDRHWKGRKPWRTYENLMRELRKSNRYKVLNARGLSDEAILEHFKIPTQIRIFDWKEGEVIKEMTPLDSVKYYISLLHAGFLAAEPQTGKIKAWVGGIDYGYFQYDHVKSKRQIGSIFKPIVYTEAIRQGISPCSYFQNTLVEYPAWENWKPSNADGQYGGFYSMAGGLSKSINTITVEVLFQSKIAPVRNLGKQMGIKGSIPTGPAIALGTVEASLEEMVTVYNTYANRGKPMSLYSIARIEDAAGKVLYKAPEVSLRKVVPLFSPSKADMVIKLLESVVDSGTARSLRRDFRLTGAIAGKTGTTQNHSDGWFIGFTPNLVAGAWVGAESPRVHFRSLHLGQGAKTALPIWGHFMRKVYNDKKFRSIRYAKFAAPSQEILDELDCENFISDEALDFAFYLEQETESGGLGNFFNRQDTFYVSQDDLKEGLSEEEVSALQDRIEKLKKKQERREKLKNLWSEKLFGKKDKGNDQ